MQPIKYHYSRANSVINTAIALVPICMSVQPIITALQKSDTSIWILLAFVFCFFALLVFLVFKFLIPALQSKIALEINQKGITSYIKNVIVFWKDIEEIELRTSKTSSYLHITFKWETDHGRSLNINLLYVQGDDQKIFDNINDCFKRHGY